MYQSFNPQNFQDKHLLGHPQTGQDNIHQKFQMHKFLTNAPQTIYISKSHCKPSSSRSHKDNLFSPKHPIFEGEKNNFEKCVNAFARSKPAGSWTRQECLSGARHIWKEEICLNSSANSIDEQKLAVWLQRYPAPLCVPNVYLPKKTNSLPPQTVPIPTAVVLLKSNAPPTAPTFGSSLQSVLVEKLAIAWEIDAHKLASVCTRESAFLNILVNCSHHFLKFETLSRQLEIVFRAGKRDVSAKSKVRSAMTSFTASIRAVKSNLKSGVEIYCDCMRRSVTDNLASDFVSSKLQLSSVMHELSKLATEMSTRDSSKNSLLFAMEND